MRKNILLFLLITVAFGVSSCGGSTATTVPQGGQDNAGFIAALEGEGATVEEGEPITQPFFSPEGNTYKVNGADIQVFEYPDEDAMENEASQVAPDGGSVGTSMVSWMDTPHFYKAGRIIILYVGNDPAVLGLLESTIGPQFAGG